MPGELLQQLTTGWTEMLVYVAIGMVTLIGFLKCVYPVFRNGSLLNHSVVKLEKGMTKGEQVIWRDPRFLGRSLRGDWQRFLLNAGQLDLRGMPCGMDEYINEDTVIYKPGHAQLAELVPSLLTSLGILGTFMGLMEGLTNLDFSNAAGTIESIPSLLNGMRFAFATSVAGIACSLSFNMFNRIVVGRAFKALDMFDEAFYELAMPRPLDPNVQIICQKQDDETNLRRVTEAVSGHIISATELALNRAMQPLASSMDNFTKGLAQEQAYGLQKIVEQFIGQMNASLNGQMSALAKTLQMVNQGQLEAQQNLKRTLEISETLTNDAARIQEASHDIATRMMNLSVEMDMAQKIRVASGTAVAQAMEATNLSLQEELESLTASLARMKEVVDGLTNQTGHSPSQSATETESAHSLRTEKPESGWQGEPSKKRFKGVHKSKSTLPSVFQHSPELEA